MATITKKRGARRGMTLQTSPSYFDVVTPVRLREVPASARTPKRPKYRAQWYRHVVRPAGAKLLKAFHRSQLRDLHATKPQHPAYGRRSERA